MQSINTPPHAKKDTLNNAIAFDRQHIWHPYSSISETNPLFHVDSAHGVYLHLSDGRKLIDGMSSWWCTVHGYNHPVLNEAITTQLKNMSHIMFGGLTHEPAISLARKLVELTPAPLQTVFFADSGSVSVEVAIKMAIQFWRAKNNNQRSKLLTIKGGYHGDTTGAMSVCDPVNGMHRVFNNLLMEQIFIEKPTALFNDKWKEEHIEPFKEALYTHKSELAGVILEPIVQGAGGMRFYSPDYLRRVSELCKETGILLIADEIATGFGRTGKLFACEYANISPDIMCVGKALTGGYMTLAATLCTKEVSDVISDTGVFMHGPTFMANPLACSVACASINLLLQNNWQQQVKRIEKKLSTSLSPCKDMPHVKNIRILGAIGVIELKEPVNIKQIQPAFVDAGVWIRPFGTLIYVMPPFIISDCELDVLCHAIVKILSDNTKTCF